MSTEDRLRRALDAQAAAYDPSPDAHERIEEKLMSEQRFTERQRWMIGGVSVAAALLLVIVATATLTGSDNPDEPVFTDSTAVTTTVPDSTTSTTTTTPSSTTTRPVPVVDPYTVAFPDPGSSRRFDDPAAAARAYATDVLGFTELVVSEFQQGDSRSGEVPVSDRADGPVTTVLVRLMADDTWYVLGSESPNITVTSPFTGEFVRSGFSATGSALAFEGVVDVKVHEVGNPDIVGEGFVMGSGTPPAGPFSNQITYEATTDNAPGIVVFRTESAEDGRVVEATSLRVVLTDGVIPVVDDGEEPVDDSQCAGTADPDTGVEGDERVVAVHLLCDEAVIPVRRSIPASELAMLTRTLELLLAGPTEAEAEQGFSSSFPASLSVTSVVLTDGNAVVDIAGPFTDEIPNASAAILAVREQLFRTATQFSTVSSVEVHLDGSCDTYAAWAQSDTCVIDSPA